MVWLVLTFGYVLLYTNCPYSIDTMYYYWTSYTIIIEHPYLTFKRNVQLLYSTGHTCICMHTCSHTSQTYIHTCNYVCTSPPTPWNTDVLLILVPFLQDDSGWPLVESSLAKIKKLGRLTLDSCNAFLLNMVTAITKNTSIHTLHLDSESL